MINNISCINFNTKITFTSPFVKVHCNSGVSKESFDLFFNTLLTLTNSKDSLTLDGLNDFKQLMSNENIDNTKAYVFVETVLMNFDKISTDKSTISRNDLYKYFSTANVNTSNSSSFVDDVTSLFGNKNKHLLFFLEFMNQFSKDTLEKIGTKHSFSVARGERKVPVMESATTKELPESKKRLTFPINISV